MSERQEIDRSNTGRASAGNPELRVQRRNQQPWIEPGNVAAQQRLEPGLTRVSVKCVV